MADIAVPFSDTFNRADSNSVGSFWLEHNTNKSELANGTAYFHGGSSYSDRAIIYSPLFDIDQSKTYVLEYHMKFQNNIAEKDTYYMSYLSNDVNWAVFHVYVNDNHLQNGGDDNYFWCSVANGDWHDTGEFAIREQWGYFKFIIDFDSKTFSGWRDDVLIWDNLIFTGAVTDQIRLNFATGETTGTTQMWLDNVSFSKAPEFNSTSDVITNPWLGLFNVGDNYSLAGYGTFEGALRSYSLIGKETVLGVNCLVLHVEGHGENPITEYYDARIFQDVDGNLRVLKMTGMDDGGTAVNWQVSSTDAAPILIPADPQAEQVYSFVDGEYHEVIAMDQTVGQMSTGMGPYIDCMQYNWNEGKDADDVDQQFHCPGIGIVKEIWDDDGSSNGWERIASTDISNSISWVYIDDDPGVTGHEGFTGFMSKYEITNAQYCKYLNEALSSDAVIVDGDYVKGNSGIYSGQSYYQLNGPGLTVDSAINGGAARIQWTGSAFSVDPGFEMHPVTYVSWHGAMAFCDYYGFSLPTQWEWLAVADYEGTWGTPAYGCGPEINNNIANYSGSTHPHGTTEVGTYGSFGHGLCDFAGNVWEWTNSVNGEYRFIRGGCWDLAAQNCTLEYSYEHYPDFMHYGIGFRVCFTTPVDEYWNGWVGTNVSSHSPATDSGQAYIAEETVSLEYTSEDGSSEKKNMTILSSWYDLEGWFNMHLWEEGGSEILQFLKGNNSLAYLHRQPDEDNDLGATLLVKKAIGASDSDIAGEYGYFGHWQTVSLTSSASEFGTVHFNSDYSYTYSGYDSDSQPVSETGTWSLDPVNAIVTVDITGKGESELQAGQDGVLMHFDIDPAEDDDLGYSYLVKKGSQKTFENIAGRYLYQEFSTNDLTNEPSTGWGILEFEIDGTWSISCTYNDGTTDADSGTFTIDTNGKILIDNVTETYDGVLSYNDQSVVISLVGQKDYEVGIGFAQRSSDCNANGILDVFEIRGDIDGNGTVNFIDFAKLAEYWLEDNCGMCGCADMSCNGKVDMDDLNTFSENWLNGAP